MDNTIWHWLMPAICISIAFAIGIGIGVPIGWKKERVPAAVSPRAVYLLMFESAVFGSCLTKSISIYRNFPEDMFWYFGAGVAVLAMVWTLPRTSKEQENTQVTCDHKD